MTLAAAAPIIRSFVTRSAAMKRNSPDYVSEKMHLAITCMCGKGSLGERLADAGISAFAAVRDEDVGPGPLNADLRYVLQWTKHNLKGDLDVTKLPDDLELGQIIEKMLHILLELRAAERD
jgi:hypothetical protein